MRSREAQAETDDDRPLLTVKQAAEKVGVKERAFRGWIARGRLPVVKLSRRAVRIRPRDIDKFVESCLNQSGG